MNKGDVDSEFATTENVASGISVKNKGKSRGKKRKRRDSETSSENEDVLADNSVEVDRCLHASAIKNNLDETSVRKIIKKVVTNNRVLALVKMREEEDSGLDEDSLRPKLTRAKVKELRKVSPKIHSATAWNLENLELTPIKHIPVKTRPEVKALIAQELPEDEDDEEYEPTHDDVPSDDDQALESCSDLESQPRTPATPRSQHSTSPKVVKDGPFKVPQDMSTPTRRKLDLEEEATIARRTRSKLSLSSTSIEHIESTFVPPDDIPMPAVDDLWNQFLNECLNPASTTRNEDDDEADPEYNVAADQDAHDEDEESLGNSIIKISKKELNDLVTELFNIIPESTPEDELMADNLASTVLSEPNQTEVSNHWEGKQEPVSDDENGHKKSFSDRIMFEKKNYSRVSQGKSEPQDSEQVASEGEVAIQPKKDGGKDKKKPAERRISPRKQPATMRVTLQQEEVPSSIESAPPLLQENLKPVPQTTEYVQIEVSQAVKMLPEQVQILQQQLRQHVQLATSNYLQLYVHPIHWSYASKYKEYLVAFSKMVESNPKSVANVCNLASAVELITTWEKSVSENTPENREMIDFIQNEVDRCQRRGFHKNLYVGEFHPTLQKVVANSPVFLYPYLLPSMPYRGDQPRRFNYLHSEDAFIALGMEQFWEFVLSNSALYKKPCSRWPWGLTPVLQLVTKHMLPWVTFRVLLAHVQNVRKHGDKDNPINIYMRTRSVTPVKHKLLPYNPKLCLYEQPEHEVPRIWVRYLAKTSKRFRNYLNKRTDRTGVPAYGVDIEMGQAVAEPIKTALPIDLINPIVAQPQLTINTLTDRLDIQITVYVTKFQLKLIMKTTEAHKQFKKNICNIFAKFNPYEHDPLVLAAQMEKICGSKFLDVYKEFLCFLTPEQADKIDAFRDYFRRNCVMDLIKKIEEQVTDLEKRYTILQELNKVFSKNLSTACEMCTDILRALHAQPALARHVHELFPHRKDTSPEQTAPPPPTPVPPQSTDKPTEETICNNTIGEVTADYEADMSMSEEEDNDENKDHSDSENNLDICRPIKEENTSMDYPAQKSEGISLVVTVSKTEVNDDSECSNSSMQIMFEDGIVKTENPEWRRDEDKLLLEVLKEQLTPKERQEKTILEIIDDKHIIGMIADSLTEKSKEEIRSRILYLLQIC